MKTILLTSLLLVFNLLPSVLHAATYYVSLSGSNSNSGTSTSSPWQTISKVNTKNFNGDTVLFQGGSTFSGSISFSSSDIGSSSKPIVIGSYGTGKATISSGTAYGIFIYNAAGFKIKDLIFKGSGRTTNTSNGIYIYMDKASTILSYLRIENVEAYGYLKAGISVGSWNKASGFNDVSIKNSLSHDNGSAGIDFYAETTFVHKNIYVGYNKVYNNSGIAENTTGSTGSGIVLGNVDGAVIEYCSSYNNGWLHSNTYGGPVGIWAYASNNVTIQKNESHHNKTGNSKDGGGYDLDGCTNSIMQYNYSHDNYGAAYLIARYSGAPIVKNIIIRYNISENDGRKNDYGGIHLWSSGTTLGIQNVEIYNNTVYLTPIAYAHPKGFYVRSGGFSGINVRNNIFQTTGGVEIISAGLSGFTFNGNDYWSSGSTFKIYWKGATYSSLTSWRTAAGQEKFSDGSLSGIQADPQFANTTTGVTFSDATQITRIERYKLKSTSGLINKGLNLNKLSGINVGTRDFWGNSIVNKSTFNVGAYQVTTSGRPISEQAENNQITRAGLYTFPNPVSSTATVSFALPTSGKATIMLYNAEGQLVRTLFVGEMKAGEYQNVTLDAGSSLANGLYLIRLFSGEEVLTQRIVVRK